MMDWNCEKVLICLNRFKIKDEYKLELKHLKPETIWCDKKIDTKNKEWRKCTKS